MDWIKRNLYFLIGSLVALALMGLAGWYLYSRWQLNNELLGKLDEQYATLKDLNSQPLHPGAGQVDNIGAAKEQQKALRAYLQKARQYFEPCPAIPIPQSGKLTPQEFSSALSRTLDEMQRDAAKASVTLPPKETSGQAYSFSFAAQRAMLEYARGSLEPLSVQLAEIKGICGVLFQAKVNSLDNIRRERVSDDDSKGPQTDYLMDKSLTNELAVISPYEVTFRCFSPELAAVLAGFSAAPCGLLIKTINVESAPAGAAGPEGTTGIANPYTPPTVTPGESEIAREQRALAEQARAAEAGRLGGRYGLRGPGMGGGDRYGDRYRGGPGPQPYAPQPYVPPVAPAPVGRGGLPTALNEKQLKVTLMLNAVKLLAAK